ncbi:vanadium-dependent haloperoxidase [Tropicimonas marinistellae]|uniref:vanadium-dependent haloperoxidase n=1 Tax=Tropicimonas marinistellae TaxID=1739787 RepID=UPI000836280C|nr:vanadium-dependent haloperoxidase [Tropicimonas marinistellae]
MDDELRPIPDGAIRKTIAQRVRDTATETADRRTDALEQARNADLDLALGSNAPWVPAWGTFTKGLAHDAFGRVRSTDLRALIAALNQAPDDAGQSGESPFPGVYKGPGAGRPARFDAPLYTGTFARPQASHNGTARAWESPLCGHVFDLEGADADQTAMPPAPELGSAEVTAELAEIYCAALLRDTPFTAWQTDPDVAQLVAKLTTLSFFQPNTPLPPDAVKRRTARLAQGQLTESVLFRGSTPGAKAGPYISQFLLIGNAERPSPAAETDADPLPGDAFARAQVFVPKPGDTSAANAVAAADGFIRYGIQAISQQYMGHADGLDHMTEWASWLDVQNGANRKDNYDHYRDSPRFISTPRDLATYVHFDALYQAYLNAVLILLGMGAETDAGLPEGPGNPTRDAFATFGGPHILTLVTEVATRALKAVRRQKYNIHLRARPEALAAAVSLAWRGGAAADSLGNQKTACIATMLELANTSLLTRIRDHNMAMNDAIWSRQFAVDLGPLDAAHNALLPMAFPEGSPMHPSYGAGHATVAGACVTVVKAFFEMFETPVARTAFNIYDVVDRPKGYPALKFPAELFGAEKHLLGDSAPFEPDPGADGTRLRRSGHAPVTTQGELDKLAANISIGRNFGGVHYYTDYYESLRMGERIAVSILQEQMLTYREPVFMRFTSFDGDRIMLAGTGGSRGQNDALVYVWDDQGTGGDAASYENWWNRHS